MTAQVVSSSGASLARRRNSGRSFSASVERMHEKPGQDLRPQRVEPELERGDDAEIAAAAPQRPEEIRVFLFARSDQLAVSRDNLRRNEIVDGQPKLACGPAKAAAEREACDAGRRIDARRRCKTELFASLSKSASVAPGSTRAVREAG